jgi:cell division protein FtsN
MEFKSKTDTVDVTQTGRIDSITTGGREAKIRFMVQIGAFKEPRLAAAVQALARERFRMPVLNDYFLQSGLYQIRIGFFETRDAATAFLARMKKEYPEDYKDAWVVQLRR